LPGFDGRYLQVDDGAELFTDDEGEAGVGEAAVDHVQTEEARVDEGEVVDVARDEAVAGDYAENSQI